MLALCFPSADQECGHSCSVRCTASATDYRHQQPVSFTIGGHHKSTARLSDRITIDPGDHAPSGLAQSDAGSEMHAPGQVTAIRDVRSALAGGDPGQRQSRGHDPGPEALHEPVPGQQRSSAESMTVLNPRLAFPRKVWSVPSSRVRTW